MLKKVLSRLARLAATWSCSGEPGSGRGVPGCRQREGEHVGSRPRPNGSGGRAEPEPETVDPLADMARAERDESGSRCGTGL